MKREVHVRNGQIFCCTGAIQLGDALTSGYGGRHRGFADALSIIASENGKNAVADQFQNIPALMINRRRSEERRVGKEGRCRWWTYQEKIKRHGVKRDGGRGDG